MQEKRTWRLASNYRVFMRFALAFFLLIVALILSRVIRGEGGREGTWIFIVMIIFMLSLFASEAYRGITSITIEGGLIELRSLLSRHRIAADDILSIEASWWDIYRGSPTIRTRTASFSLQGPFDAFFDLLTTLKALNPSIDIRRL